MSRRFQLSWQALLIRVAMLGRTIERVKWHDVQFQLDRG